MPSENTENRGGANLSPENEPIPQTPVPEDAAPAFPESDEDCAVFLRRNQLSSTPPLPADQLTPPRGRSTRRFTKLFAKFLPVPPVLAALAGICWALTCRLDFDWNIGHPAAGSVWYGLTIALLLLGTVSAAAVMIPAFRTRQYRMPRTGPGETFSAFLAAALFGIRCLRQVYDLATTAPDSAAAGLLDKLCVPAMLLCALYFLCAGLGKKGGIMTFLSMGSCLAVMLTLFRDYFDFTLPLNSPIRNLSMLVYAALLLFFLAETRMHVDLWYAGMPFSVLAYTSVILLAGGIGLGQAVTALLGNAQFNLIEETAFVAAAALAFFRLKQLPALIADHLPPPPTEDEVKKAEKKNRK
ncbi:MAG: hypothetical protein IJ480_11655 [Clostridia bacterium]|nr:hypothetical protein [Clostridia bacterium]